MRVGRGGMGEEGIADSDEIANCDRIQRQRECSAVGEDASQNGGKSRLRRKRKMQGSERETLRSERDRLGQRGEKDYPDHRPPPRGRPGSPVDRVTHSARITPAAKLVKDKDKKTKKKMQRPDRQKQRCKKTSVRQFLQTVIHSLKQMVQQQSVTDSCTTSICWRRNHRRRAMICVCEHSHFLLTFVTLSGTTAGASVLEEKQTHKWRQTEADRQIGRDRMEFEPTT